MQAVAAFATQFDAGPVRRYDVAELRCRNRRAFTRDLNLLGKTARIKAIAKHAVRRADRCALGDPVVDQRLLLRTERIGWKSVGHAHANRRCVAVDLLKQQTGFWM